MSSWQLSDFWLCDGHADTFRNQLMLGGDFLRGRGGHHLSYPRLQAGGVNLQIMAIYTAYEEVGPLATVTALRILREARQVTDPPDSPVQLLTRGPITADLAAPPSILLSLEGADPLVGDLKLLEVFYELGVRAIGFTHNHNSCAAGGCAPPAPAQRAGLTGFGRELLAEMNRKGMLVDTAHLSRRAFDEMVSLHRGPLINSHSCAAALVPTERNLSDEQLRDLAATGGLAAVTYVPKFLRSDCNGVTSLDVFRHLEHMAEIAGIEHVALGSDFDGVEHLPEDLSGPEQVCNLIGHMERAGWTREQIASVLGLNWLRVLNQVLPHGE